jgi:hypothetical protein
MAFTSNSDLFGAVHEEGLNRVVRHIMRQRPSLFNYGTALVQANPALLCEPIEAAPRVTQLISLLPPIPLFGADQFALNYCFQLTNLEIEFHPGNTITLPPELNPPLGEQRFAFRARGCGGLGCPSREFKPIVDLILELSQIATLRQATRPSLTREIPAESFATARAAPRDVLQDILVRPDQVFVPRQHVFPTRQLACFCLDLLATGRAGLIGPEGNKRVNVQLDNLEIVDLTPGGLEKSLECYFLLVVNQGILPQVNTAISETLFKMIDFGEFGSLTVSASTAVPNNPALEEEQLKTFIDLQSFVLQVPPIVVEAGGDGGGNGGPDITKTVRPRTRSGPFHLTAAVSEGAFIQVFEAIRDHTTFDITIEPRSILGPVSAGAHLRFHLENGNINFGDDNTVQIDELDIDWEDLRVTLAINIPEICIPPFQICTPIGCTPQFCVFEGENDVSLTLVIPAIFTSEVSIKLRPQVYYGISAAGNRWIIKLEPVGPVDIDIIDVSASIGEILDNAIGDALDELGLLGDILDKAVEAIKDILDIGDDIQEWIKDLVFDTLGIELGIDNLLFDFFTDNFKILDLEDPVEVLPADGALIPVRIPFEFIGARVNNAELIIEVDVEE